MSGNYYEYKQNIQPQFGTATNNFGMNVSPQNPVTNTSMTAGMDVEALKNAGSDSFIAQRLTSFSDVDPLLQYGVAIPTWIAVNQGMDKYTKLFRGDYNKSISYKIGHAGDVVSDFLFKNPVGRAINKATNATGRFLKKNIYDKSAILRAWETPASPELTLVKHQMHGITGMIRTDAMNIMEEFLNPIENVKDLDCLGATKDQIKQVEKELIGKTAEQQKLILEKAQYKLLNRGATPEQIKGFLNSGPFTREIFLKEMKAKALSFKDLKEFEAIKAAPNENAVRLLEVLKNAPRNMYSRISYSNKNAYSTVKGGLFGRKEYFDAVFNKLVACEKPEILRQLNIQTHTTKLGRALAKMHLQFMEGATSRISGGKLAAAMQAFFIAEALIRANRQETNGDKFKSFMERMAELVGFFVFMPPAVQLTFHMAGFANAGMTPQQAENYRKAVEKFNEKVINGTFKNKYNIYKQERKALEAMRPKTRNPIKWFVRKCGKIVGVGIDQIRPYTRQTYEKITLKDLNPLQIFSNPKSLGHAWAQRLKDIFHNPKYWLKQGLGYPMRFGIPMLLFIPFANKFLVKGSHAIFGKPKESLLDEEKYMEEQEKAKEAQMQQQIQGQNAIPTLTPSQQAGYVMANPNNQGVRVASQGSLTPNSQNPRPTAVPPQNEINKMQIHDAFVRSAQAQSGMGTNTRPIAQTSPQETAAKTGGQNIKQASTNTAEVKTENSSIDDKQANSPNENKDNNSNTAVKTGSQNSEKQSRSEKSSNSTVKEVKNEQNSNQKNSATKPTYSYIPSSAGIKLKEKNINNSEVDKALKRAEKAEQEAINVLSI